MAERPPTVEIERDGPRAILRLNRPARLNAVFHTDE